MSQPVISQTQLEELINRHALKASASSYDADVCISAISNLRVELMALPTDCNSKISLENVINLVGDIARTYSDPDGQYTSGRSVIIGLLDDLYCLKMDQEEQEN